MANCDENMDQEQRDCCELTTDLSFSAALHRLKSGKRIRRTGWNGKNMWLELHTPNEKSKMTLPYIYMLTACNNFVPWLASQTDMLEDDWEEVEKANVEEIKTESV